MTLYEKFAKSAYDQKGRALKGYWDSYLPREQVIYQDILGNKIISFSGNVSELSKKYALEPYEFVGFTDGISGALKEPLDPQELTEDSQINLEIDFASLYKKMVEYKAEHLYTLEEWDGIFTKEERDKLFAEQRGSGTIIKGKQPGRNDPCPCQSGKKFKHCCQKA